MKDKETASTPNRKKLIYSILAAVCALLLIAATVLTVYFVTNRPREVLDAPPVDDNPVDDTPDDPPVDSKPEDPPVDDKPDDPPVDNTPSGGEGKVLFAAPVEGATCTLEYMTVYNNASLDKWYRHCAVDFAAEEGTKVLAMSDGVVAEISLSAELGNLITLEHEGGVKTIYRFVEPTASLKVGDHVTQGQQIGSVAAAYGTEYKDGAHLHLEMKVNGEHVDPMDYIDATLEEK